MKKTLILAFIMPLVAAAADCKIETVREVDLKTRFPEAPTLLHDQTLVASRQDEGSYFFIKPDGRVLDFSTNGESATVSATELKSGRVLISSQYGTLHFLDSSGVEQSRFTSGIHDYVWHTAELSNGSLVVLANRDDGHSPDPLGAVYFLNPDGSKKSMLDLGRDAVWSKPLILPDDTIVFKTQTSKVFFLNPDGSVKFKEVFGGKRGGELLTRLDDGTILTGGDFDDSKKVLFIDPASGSAISELRFETKSPLGLEQDIWFITKLSGNRFAIGFSEYEYAADGTSKDHLRLQVHSRDGSLLGQSRLENVDGSIYSNLAELADGTIVLPANNGLYFFDRNGALEFKHELSLPSGDAPPVVMNDGTIVVTASRVSEPFQSTLYFLKRDCR